MLTHTFKFTNSGSDTLIISNVEVQCGCTEAELSQKVLLPGESANIKVILNTTTLDGLSVRKVILYTNTKEGKKEISLTTEVFE